MMELEVLRYWSRENETLGLLFAVENGRREFLAYTLEDEYRTEKVFGETRIPEGIYPLALRTEGGHHQRYTKRFAAIHEGMLWVQDVPNFKWILIHIGNSDDDTAGCLLVGTFPANWGSRIIDSERAYLKVYTRVLDAMKRGQSVQIRYVDYDTPEAMA